MTLRELIRKTRSELSGENADFEARQMVFSACKTDATRLLLCDRQATDSEQAAIDEFVKRRNAGEPLYYILGKAEFYSIPLKVSSDTLIPRQDSELIVDLALGYAKENPVKKACDLCSGSGAIGIAFSENSGVHTDCVELYDGAFSILSENVKRFKNAFAVQADALKFDLSGYELITCNPPYIAQSERQMLSKEVMNEPETALFAPEGGLMFYRVISGNLKSGAHIIYEIGFSQAKSVCEILLKSGFRDIKTHKDLNGLDRAVEATKI